jgi:hypothetical protein
MAQPIDAGRDLTAEMGNDGIDPLQLVPPFDWDSAPNIRANCPLITTIILGQFTLIASMHEVVGSEP